MMVVVTMTATAWMGGPNRCLQAMMRSLGDSFDFGYPWARLLPPSLISSISEGPTRLPSLLLDILEKKSERGGGGG